MEKKAGDNQELIAILEIWINIEKSTIEATSSILPKVNDKLLRALISDIRGDSRKHKELLELVLAQEKNESKLMLGQEETILKSFIDTHALLEANAVEMAEDAVNKVTNPVSKLVLSYILQDEKKHDFLMDALEKHYQET
ncbi:MAG: hypothetical protein HOD92_08085 [Deltaproteobacteria bacterium]|jgi:rubrerythrin|nr:hypothetical protein [Deltaproteobacteria bacterium]